MIEARIMLTTVSLIAVVGGALALKAHRFGGDLLCKTTTASTVYCTIEAVPTNGSGFNAYCTGVENVPPAGTTLCTHFLMKLTKRL